MPKPDAKAPASWLCAGLRARSRLLVFARAGIHNLLMADLDPVIEAYKKGVDRTLLRANLELTVEERIRKMMGALRLVEEIRRSRGAAR